MGFSFRNSFLVLSLPLKPDSQRHIYSCSINRFSYLSFGFQLVRKKNGHVTFGTFCFFVFFFSRFKYVLVRSSHFQAKNKQLHLFIGEFYRKLMIKLSQSLRISFGVILYHGYPCFNLLHNIFLTCLLWFVCSPTFSYKP